MLLSVTPFPCHPPTFLHSKSLLKMASWHLHISFHPKFVPPMYFNILIIFNCAFNLTSRMKNISVKWFHVLFTVSKKKNIQKEVHQILYTVTVIQATCVPSS